MGPHATVFLIETNNYALQRPRPGKAVVSAFAGAAKIERKEKAAVARHALQTFIRYRPFYRVLRENSLSIFSGLPRKLSLSLVAMDGNVSLGGTYLGQGL